MKMTPQDLYATGRPPLVKTAALAILLTVICVSIADITGASNTTKLMLIVLALAVTVGCEIYLYRRWQKRTERPALLRKNLAPLLRTDLPPASTVASGHTFGRLLSPGPARRIRITQPGMPPVEGDLAQKVLHLAGEIYQNEYVLNTKKSIPGKRIVLAQKPKEKRVQLTLVEQIEQNIVKAAQDIFPKHTPKARFEWDEKADEPYLLGVTISEVSGMDLALPGKRRQIIIKLRTRLPRGNFVAEADPNEDAIYFSRSRPLPNVVVPPAEHAPLLTSHEAYSDFFVPLGIGDNEQQAIWHPRKDVHLLIIGGTGGGKTVAEHGVIQRLTQAGWRTWLVDGKRIEFIGYREWENVEMLAQRLDEQIRLIKLAHDTMNARYDLIMESKVRVADLDPIVLVIDEVTSLLFAIKERYQETKEKGMRASHPVLGWIADIARLGRSSKIHLVLGLQRPDADFVGGEMRDNFGARLSLGKLQSKEASIMMWQDPAIGVSVPNIKGRGVSYVNGNLGIIQGAFTANPDPNHDDYHRGMVEAMRPKNKIYSRKTIAPPEPSDDEEGKITWSNIIEARILAEDGTPIEFDPVSSEESRKLRSDYQNAELSKSRTQLQAADTFDEALSYFAYNPTDRIIYGKQMALKLAALAEHLHPENDAPQIKEDTPIFTESTDVPSVEGRSTELRYIKPGQSIISDDLGEEITVSTCEPDPEDPTTYYLTGWTAEGEEVHLELPADTTVEAFELESEYSSHA